MTYDQPWEVVPNTGERVLRNKKTGDIMQFNDDPEDRSMEIPMYGIDTMFSQEDLKRLRERYTDYEICEGV